MMITDNAFAWSLSIPPSPSQLQTETTAIQHQPTQQLHFEVAESEFHSHRQNNDGHHIDFNYIDPIGPFTGPSMSTLQSHIVNNANTLTRLNAGTERPSAFIETAQESNLFLRVDTSSFWNGPLTYQHQEHDQNDNTELVWEGDVDGEVVSPQNGHQTPANLLRRIRAPSVSFSDDDTENSDATPNFRDGALRSEPSLPFATVDAEFRFSIPPNPTHHHTQQSHVQSSTPSRPFLTVNTSSLATPTSSTPVATAATESVFTLIPPFHLISPTTSTSPNPSPTSPYSRYSFQETHTHRNVNEHNFDDKPENMPQSTLFYANRHSAFTQRQHQYNRTREAHAPLSVTFPLTVTTQPQNHHTSSFLSSRRRPSTTTNTTPTTSFQSFPNSNTHSTATTTTKSDFLSSVSSTPSLATVILRCLQSRATEIRNEVFNHDGDLDWVGNCVAASLHYGHEMELEVEKDKESVSVDLGNDEQVRFEQELEGTSAWLNSPVDNSTQLLESTELGHNENESLDDDLATNISFLSLEASELGNRWLTGYNNLTSQDRNPLGGILGTKKYSKAYRIRWLHQRRDDLEVLLKELDYIEGNVERLSGLVPIGR
ncbi:hypothetical protein HDU76_011424 [Blyttiomyces sp. JEL0837]|nr:hypothetical protein HDU76_011424 [Blyttiomyces sp. JEL0837]